MDKNTKEQIRQGLLEHRGAIAEVVRRTDRLKEGGYSRAQVDYVLRDVSCNEEIMALAAEVLSERQKRRAEVVATVTAQVEQLEATA